MINSIKKNSKFLILLIVMAMLPVAFLVGCSVESLTESDIIKMGYTVKVVYEYNGGFVGGSEATGVSNRTIRVKEDSYLPEPGTTAAGSFTAPSRVGYSLRGFCVAQKDGEGELLRDSEGSLIPGREWNFDVDKATEDVTLCAVWWKNYTVRFKYGDDKEQLIEIRRNKSGYPDKLYDSQFSVEDSITVIDYYLDKEMQDILEFDGNHAYEFTPDDFAASEDGLTVTVWGKSINGNYTVVKQASDFYNLDIHDDTNIYFVNDIDVNGQTCSFPSTYGGTIIGNGKTVSNMKVKLSAANNKDIYFGLFKKLNATADISDITFVDASINYELSNSAANDYYVGVLAGVMESGANVKNVAFSSPKISYVIASGLNSDFVHIDYASPLLGNTALSAEPDSSCTVSDVAYTGSVSIIDNSGLYAVYAMYDRDKDGNITIGDVYGIADIKEGGTYTAVRLKADVVKNGDGSFTLNQSRGEKRIFTVTADYAEGAFSATVSVSVDQN